MRPLLGGHMRTIRLIAMTAGLFLVQLAPAPASAADLQPGFYPGGAEMSITDQAAYKAFLDHNKEKIQQIGLNIIILGSEPPSKIVSGASVPACIASIARDLAGGFPLYCRSALPFSKMRRSDESRRRHQWEANSLALSKQLDAPDRNAGRGPR